jgi:hypothetical protein
MAFDYSRETCHGCKGAGHRGGKSACAACEGRGWLLVLRPPIQCPRCEGSTRGITNNFCSTLDYCEICLGTGWVRTSRHFAGNEEQHHSHKCR